MASRGLVAEMGRDAYPHKFGGSSWAIRAPGTPVPALLVRLVTSDPRLELDPRLGEVPLCSRLDGASLGRQSYVFDHATRAVTFDGEPWDVEPDPSDALTGPLPESPLRLRPLTAAEDEAQSDRYEVQDTFLGGSSFLRVGGAPLWVFDAEDVQCRCGRECDFVASIGYENYDRPSGLVAPGKPFFFGEVALYFFLCLPCTRMAVLSQATLRSDVTMRLIEIASGSMSVAKPLAAEAGQEVSGDGGNGGVVGLSGFFRIYPPPVVPAWNEPQRWRFAWGELAEGWHFVGGTAFGDQYALRPGSDEVFVLDAFPFAVTRSWPNLAELVASEPAVFLDESAEIVEDVVQLLGAPPAEQHVVFAPPHRISGEMHASGAMFMPAATAMVLNGDIALQAREALGKIVEGVETVVDDAGRPRIRLRTR